MLLKIFKKDVSVYKIGLKLDVNRRNISCKIRLFNLITIIYNITELMTVNVLHFTSQ